MKIVGKFYTECQRFEIFPWDDREAIKEMIVKRHYLKKWPTVAQYCFGIVKDGNQLVGAIVFGWPNVYRLSKSISPVLEDSQVCELLRLWIEDGHGCNIETRAITQAFKLLPEHIKVVYSLADPEQGHLGKIYQGANGWFQDLGDKDSSHLLNFTDPNNPKGWKHFRWVQRHLSGTRDLNTKLAHLDRYWKKPVSSKYRYLWFTCSKTERKKIVETLRHPITKNYPDPEEIRPRGKIEEIVLRKQAA